MNKFLHVIFILLILAMLSAAIIQIFQPQLLGAGLAPTGREKSASGIWLFCRYYLPPT